jgi:hypothetical protein
VISTLIQFKVHNEKIAASGKRFPETLSLWEREG